MALVEGRAAPPKRAVPIAPAEALKSPAKPIDDDSDADSYGDARARITPHVPHVTLTGPL